MEVFLSYSFFFLTGPKYNHIAIVSFVIKLTVSRNELLPVLIFWGLFLFPDSFPACHGVMSVENHIAKKIM